MAIDCRSQANDLQLFAAARQLLAPEKFFTRNCSDPTDRSRRVSAPQWHPLPPESLHRLSLHRTVWGQPDLTEAALVPRPGQTTLVGLTSVRTKMPPMLPRLNRKRALLVVTKIDEILAWERRSEAERDTRFGTGSVPVRSAGGAVLSVGEAEVLRRVSGEAVSGVPAEDSRLLGNSTVARLATKEGHEDRRNS